jgi:hypothetical protein
MSKKRLTEAQRKAISAEEPGQTLTALAKKHKVSLPTIMKYYSKKPPKKKTETPKKGLFSITQRNDLICIEIPREELMKLLLANVSAEQLVKLLKA